MKPCMLGCTDNLAHCFREKSDFSILSYRLNESGPCYLANSRKHISSFLHAPDPARHQIKTEFAYSLRQDTVCLETTGIHTGSGFLADHDV